MITTIAYEDDAKGCPGDAREEESINDECIHQKIERE